MKQLKTVNTDREDDSAIINPVDTRVVEHQAPSLVAIPLIRNKMSNIMGAKIMNLSDMGG